MTIVVIGMISMIITITMILWCGINTSTIFCTQVVAKPSGPFNKSADVPSGRHIRGPPFASMSVHITGGEELDPDGANASSAAAVGSWGRVCFFYVFF